MSTAHLAANAERHLRTLCSVAPNRRTGSPGNREATEYFARVVRSFGYTTDTTPFPCLDWSHGRSSLSNGSSEYVIEASPYSLGCDLSAPLVTAATADELRSLDCSKRILLLTGSLASEQLMPKHFPFYNPEHHQQLYALLERKRPAAIVAATQRNPESAGALYPFPLIVDGDFHIPCAHCTAETGERIASNGDGEFRLTIDAERRESSASNVVVRTHPDAARKIVVTAHIDAYEDTPGATDNAAGVVVLLLLAELLASDSGGRIAGDRMPDTSPTERFAGEIGRAAAGDTSSPGIEIAALNGEDHYGAPGQKDYLARYGESLESARAVINIDGAGYREGATAYSIYDCPDDVRRATEAAFARYSGLIEGPQWFAGDHSIFLQRGVPAIAITTARVEQLLARAAHTPEDSPEIVDCAKLAELAGALADLLGKIG